MQRIHELARLVQSLYPDTINKTRSSTELDLSRAHNVPSFTLCVLESSSFVEVVESVDSEAIDCCRPLSALESSNFIEAVESHVEAVHFCRLLLCSREF